MTPDRICVSAPLPETVSLQTASERWLRAAEADYRLCREFARRFGAHLGRSLRSQRVGWELFGHPHCALLLPDAGPASLDDEWYLYYVSGESLFRRSRAERAQVGMVVLAESADDWAELLHQALRDRVFDVRYTVTPDYVNELGEIEYTASGFVFALEAYAPQSVGTNLPRIAGVGSTPEEAAREACRCWLQSLGTETAPDAQGGTACH